MGKNKKMKIFISYSHQDNHENNHFIEDFKKHISPFKNNGLIEDWYDRKILPGEDFESKIENNLEDADIICLFISANFLSSQACIKEKNKALDLKKSKGVVVIPIILSPCGWKDEKDISSLLALPTDGNSISNFSNKDEGWLDVYNGLKKVIEKEIKTRQMEITEKHLVFLNEAQLLTKSHPEKETVVLDDIFLSPDLEEFDEMKEIKKTISFDELSDNIATYKKIVIAGEDFSGKTTLCKRFFIKLRDLNFIPVIISDREKFPGKMENKILQALKDQYKDFKGDYFTELKERIVPIVDDFHTAKNKEKHIEYLNSFTLCILIVDDIFCLNVKDENLVISFRCFKIKELKPSLRYELIKKWVNLSDREKSNIDYKELDPKVDLVNHILGKNIGKGVFPSYPFFILSSIGVYDTFAIPLDQEITSQGYCYQAFIYFFLRKKGVRNENIDTYINFLTELSFYFYKEKKYEITSDNFLNFLRTYEDKYYLTIDQDSLLKNVDLIVSIDSFGNYSYHYSYLYYFFIAKYLVEHIKEIEIKEEIEKIMNNLHVDQNAYIAIFMTHHSKDINILEEIQLNSMVLFDKWKPASLSKDEVKFFDENIDKIVKASLPSKKSPEGVRAEILGEEDKIEEQSYETETNDTNDFSPFEIDLRKSIRTAEVIGCMIKNQVGSIEKTKIKELFIEAMNVHLRIMLSFFDLIKEESNQESVIYFLSKVLNKIIEENKEKNKELTNDKIEKIARHLFWNLNFFTVYGIINKIIMSLGSDKLDEVIKEVYGEINTPSVFLVEQGILMWYKKNLRINEIENRINDKNFSEIAKKVLKFIVFRYCSTHPINFKDRQKLESIFGFKPGKLLTIQRLKL